MVWIALADRRSARFSKIGLGAQARRAATAALPDAAPMLRGSIVAEGQVPTGDRPAHLLTGKGPRFQLSLQVLPSGAGVLVLAIGGVLRHVIVPLEWVRPGDTVRLIYSWDCALGWGRLAAETPMSDLQAMARVPQPQPVTLEQLHQCICGPTSAERDSHLNFVALYCGIEPLGPMPSLTAQVPVETAFGPRPASAIRRGDLLRCLSGGLVPVLQVLRRTVPARGLWRPVQLRSPYLGLQQDVFVSPSQRLVVGGSEVEYLFGREHVALVAQDLLGGSVAPRAEGGQSVPYFGFVLPEAQAVIVAGVPMQSVNIGRIRRKPPALRASLLAGLNRAHLPEHAPSPYPLLNAFEATTLAAQRAA